MVCICVVYGVLCVSRMCYILHRDACMFYRCVCVSDGGMLSDVVICYCCMCCMCVICVVYVLYMVPYGG